MYYTVFCVGKVDGEASPVYHTQIYTEALRQAYLNQKHNPKIRRCFIRSAGIQELEEARMEDLISRAEQGETC
jgi:hypothetical protein